MCHFYNKIRKNLLIICPILNLQGCKYGGSEFTWISVKQTDKTEINTVNGPITGDYIEAHQLILGDYYGINGGHNILRFAITTDSAKSENHRTLYLERVLSTSKEDSKLQAVSNLFWWGLYYKKLSDVEMILINKMKNEMKNMKKTNKGGKSRRRRKSKHRRTRRR